MVPDQKLDPSLGPPRSDLDRPTCKGQSRNTTKRGTATVNGATRFGDGWRWILGVFAGVSQPDRNTQRPDFVGLPLVYSSLPSFAGFSSKESRASYYRYPRILGSSVDPIHDRPRRVLVSPKDDRSVFSSWSVLGSISKIWSSVADISFSMLLFLVFFFYLVSTMDYPVRDRWERSKREFSVFHLGFWFWIGDPGLKLCLVAEVCPLEARQDVQ